MLNSLLDQKLNVIKIDRLIYEDENNVKTFTNDPEIIDSKVINYYKNISSIDLEVQGALCNEIILQIQAIIDHQHDTKNPFFLAIQDLSKAYDRVNLDLLQLALRRINIPDILISFINKLFSHHRNKIIFPFGYGFEYTTTNGIIQGEVISFLLWFANNINDLQNNLAIADNFYALANIKINKDKTKILTNDPTFNKKQHIPIKFGKDTVDITIIPPSNNERILGIYVNTNNNFTFTINKINRLLKYTSSNL
ncbi:ribonuclease H-like domain-containing protein [Rhizophagus irregularis DAOM 181602=DAOM 197198]|nr:ribonuclease H-like domain-containing protein [Rhizophagus irregularis DAOM 181602=DAOM 197198]